MKMSSQTSGQSQLWLTSHRIAELTRIPPASCSCIIVATGLFRYLLYFSVRGMKLQVTINDFARTIPTVNKGKINVVVNKCDIQKWYKDESRRKMSTAR